MHIDFRHKIGRDPWFMAGLTSAGFFVLVISCGPFLSPYDPYDISFLPLSVPSFQHLLGVNDGGMDIFTELMYSLRNTVLFGVFSGAIALFIGIVIGLSAAWYGGWIEHGLMRLADVFLALPTIMVLILLAAFFRPSPFVLALILAGMMWPTTARAYRAQAMVIKKSPHVQVARQMGAGGFYIIRRHFIPELFPLYVVGFATKARTAMIMEVSLAFMGLLDPGRKSLGIMISYALKYYYLDIWWSWLLPPIACLSLLMVTATFLAVSMEKVFDPRLREAQ